MQEQQFKKSVGVDRMSGAYGGVRNNLGRCNKPLTQANQNEKKYQELKSSHQQRLNKAVPIVNSLLQKVNPNNSRTVSAFMLQFIRSSEQMVTNGESLFHAQPSVQFTRNRNGTINLTSRDNNNRVLFEVKNLSGKILYYSQVGEQLAKHGFSHNLPQQSSVVATASPNNRKPSVTSVRSNNYSSYNGSKPVINQSNARVSNNISSSLKKVSAGAENLRNGRGEISEKAVGKLERDIKNLETTSKQDLQHAQYDAKKYTASAQAELKKADKVTKMFGDGIDGMDSVSNKDVKRVMDEVMRDTNVPKGRVNDNRVAGGGLDAAQKKLLSQFPSVPKTNPNSMPKQTNQIASQNKVVTATQVSFTQKSNSNFAAQTRSGVHHTNRSTVGNVAQDMRKFNTSAQKVLGKGGQFTQKDVTKLEKGVTNMERSAQGFSRREVDRFNQQESKLNKSLAKGEAVSNTLVNRLGNMSNINEAEVDRLIEDSRGS